MCSFQHVVAVRCITGKRFIAKSVKSEKPVLHRDPPRLKNLLPITINIQNSRSLAWENTVQCSELNCCTVWIVYKENKLIVCQSAWGDDIDSKINISRPEYVFTELILQSLYWIYEIAIHDIFILDLPTNIELWTLDYLFWEGNWVFSILFDSREKCGNAWKL
jgi:hypothetical protein